MPRPARCDLSVSVDARNQVLPEYLLFPGRRNRPESLQRSFPNSIIPELSRQGSGVRECRFSMTDLWVDRNALAKFMIYSRSGFYHSLSMQAADGRWLDTYGRGTYTPSLAPKMVGVELLGFSLVFGDLNAES